MKNKIKKLLALTIVGTSLLSIIPMGVNAAWKQDSNGWWNTKGNSWSTGWENINEKWYYFGGDGYMRTGWIKDDNGKWYFLNEDGSMAKDTIVNGYKVDATGAYVDEIQIAPIVNQPIVNEQTQAKIETIVETPKETTTTTTKKRRKSSSTPSRATTPSAVTTGAGATVEEGFPITICYDKATLELAGSYVGTKDYKIFPGMPLEEAQSKYGIINTDGTSYGITSKYELILISRKLKVEVTGEGAKLIKE